MTVSTDITEGIPYDISTVAVDNSFTLTDASYDIVIDNIPFIANITNQNPYRRETAPYKKDQFDSSPEPGEQSLTGWWLRSQTSWHNGAGITFYEPGTDYQFVNHRFAESSGIDVSVIGEATLLPEVFHAYHGNTGINAAVGANGTDQCLVTGDGLGYLKRVTLNGDEHVTAVDFVETATAYPSGHNGTNHPFLSVTTDGSNYYAACNRAIHTGAISVLDEDITPLIFSTDVDRTDIFIKYSKGYILFGLGNVVYTLDVPTIASLVASHSSGTADVLGANFLTHLNKSWVWTDATASPRATFISGTGGRTSEIWKVLFDDTTNANDMPGATMSLSLPDGETVNAIHYYLGYLSIGTSHGVRICPIDGNGDPILGPLLVETAHAVNGFTDRGTFLFAATTMHPAGETHHEHAGAIRIDLSKQFDDGTFAWANDIEYRSSVNIDSEEDFVESASEATEVYNLNDRLVLVVQEGEYGKLQVEHTTRRRDTGYIQTGKIRYGTIEPKFFRFINVDCSTGSGDTITIATIDQNGAEANLQIISDGLSNQDIYISNLATKQQHISLKFTFNNSTTDTELPVLKAYQLKSVPAIRRQRLYQFPLSCYDVEMDRNNSVFGFEGRAIETINRLEAMEETGRFVKVTDHRTGESFSGIIEEVRFTNESSPDKNNSGFGGLLLVTVRKM